MGSICCSASCVSPWSFGSMPPCEGIWVSADPVWTRRIAPFVPEVLYWLSNLGCMHVLQGPYSSHLQELQYLQSMPNSSPPGCVVFLAVLLHRQTSNSNLPFFCPKTK